MKTNGWLIDLALAELFADGRPSAVVAQTPFSSPLFGNLDKVPLRASPERQRWLRRLPGGGAVADVTVTPGDDVWSGLRRRRTLLDCRGLQSADALIIDLQPSFLWLNREVTPPTGFLPLDDGTLLGREGDPNAVALQTVLNALTAGNVDPYDCLQRLSRRGGPVHDVSFSEGRAIVIAFDPRHLIVASTAQEAVAAAGLTVSGRPNHQTLSLAIPRLGNDPVDAHLTGTCRVPDVPAAASEASWQPLFTAGREWAGRLRQQTATDDPVVALTLSGPDIALNKVELLLPPLHAETDPNQIYDPLTVYDGDSWSAGQQ